VLTIPIEDFVKDKKVILVGNSIEMLKYEYGDFIDSFDVVIHMGAAIRRKDEYFKYLGSRTDIWLTGTFRFHSYHELADEFKSGKYKDTIILFNRVRTKLLRADDISAFEISLPQVPRIDMFNDFEILRLLEEFDYLEGFGDGYRGPANGQRPSAGFMALLYFTKKVTSYKSLDIIGFDFFKKVTDVKRNDDSAKPFSWHLPIRTNKGGHPHNSDIEFTYANKLCQEKKINWTILSDLEPETINLSK